MSEVRVQLDALTQYADAAERLGEDFVTTTQRLYDADVTEDSFGMLPQSREVATTYEERTTDGLDALRAGDEVFTALADAFREIHRGYQSTDTSLSDRMQVPQ